MTSISVAMSNRRPSKLVLVAGLIVLCAVIPLLFVMQSSAQLSTEQWLNLWHGRLPRLLSNTLVLAAIVALLSFVLGVSSAWLIARWQFKGRILALWLMVLPLTIPTYVFAYIYTIAMEPDGWLGLTWVWLFPESWRIPDIYGLGGAAIILALAGFSYVFLLVYAALSRSTNSLEEAARLQGYTGWQVFRRVNLPLLRPAIAAGLALIVLHTLSDFGAVSMLRYQTFTLAIYTQMSGRMDYQAAAGLSLVLVFLSLSFLVIERFFRKRQRYYSGAQSSLVQRRVATSKQQMLIWIYLGFIALFSFGLPLLWMLQWSWVALSESLLGLEFWTYAFNSGVIAFSAASIALLLAFPLAFYHSRSHSKLSESFIHLSSVGFVLPGPVIALGVLSFILAQMPVVYGSLAALIIAIVIRFLPLAIQAQESVLQQLTPSVVQAGRMLGAGPWENFYRVIVPVMRSGLATAWVLVFIDALKELPATLILRPTGFDTLPVRIWIETNKEMLKLAAPAALIIVVGTLPAIYIMMRNTLTTRQ